MAREIGLGGEAPRIVEGDELKALLDRGDTSILREVSVIARAVPAQKLGLVRALQAGGDIVAVTGDGVNDVPALQAADIGIAMGERGTRSAREVAAIVLLDDNFTSIVHAIAEGRQLFTNLQLSFQYLLMIHLPLVITAALIPLAGYPILYLPIHIVWLELIIHPTALLVFQELPSNDALAPVRRTTRLRFFDGAQWTTVAAVAALVTVVVTVSFVRSLGSGYGVDHARAMALIVLTTASAGITASLSRLRSRAARTMVAGTLLLGRFHQQCRHGHSVNAAIDGVSVSRMFNRAIAGERLPKHLSTDHDPLFRFHRWLANLRVHPDLSSLRRASNWDDPARVPGPRLLLERGRPGAKAGGIPGLLQRPTRSSRARRSPDALRPAPAALDH